MGEDEAPYPRSEAGMMGDVGLEAGSALADEVVADVGRAIRRLSGLGGLARALDQADVLEVPAPVECCAETEARDGVCHRDLGRGLALVLAPDRVLVFLL